MHRSLRAKDDNVRAMIEQHLLSSEHYVALCKAQAQIESAELAQLQTLPVVTEQPLRPSTRRSAMLAGGLALLTITLCAAAWAALLSTPTLEDKAASDPSAPAGLSGPLAPSDVGQSPDGW